MKGWMTIPLQGGPKSSYGPLINGRKYSSGFPWGVFHPAYRGYPCHPFEMASFYGTFVSFRGSIY